jgi:hypothetical protein
MEMFVIYIKFVEEKQKIKRQNAVLLCVFKLEGIRNRILMFFFCIIYTHRKVFCVLITHANF